MTAIVDLVIFQAKPDINEVYEPWWLFAHYTDTHGLWKGRDKTKETFEVKGKGVIIDALFGDGPERYGFTTNKPVILADYSNYKERCRVTNFSEPHHPGKQYVVLRSNLSECLRRVCDGMRALSLAEYVTFLMKIPAEDMQKGFGNLVPMNAFLSALELKNAIVLPVIGTSLAYELESVESSCGHRGGIIPAMYIES